MPHFQMRLNMDNDIILHPLPCVYRMVSELSPSN